MSNLLELSIPVAADQLVLVGQMGHKLVAYNAADNTVIFKPEVKLVVQQNQPEPQPVDNEGNLIPPPIDFSKRKARREFTAELPEA